MLREVVKDNPGDGFIGDELLGRIVAVMPADTDCLRCGISRKEAAGVGCNTWGRSYARHLWPEPQAALSGRGNDGRN